MLCRDSIARHDVVWPGRAYERFKDAGNMTDRLGALVALTHSHAELAELALQRFHTLFKHEALCGRQVVHAASDHARKRRPGVRAGQAPA